MSPGVKGWRFRRPSARHEVTDSCKNDPTPWMVRVQIVLYGDMEVTWLHILLEYKAVRIVLHLGQKPYGKYV